MITGTFSIPENLTPELAQEFISVATLFKPLNRERLRNTVHRALCEELANVRKKNYHYFLNLTS